MTQISGTALPLRYKALITLALAVLAVAGNYLSVPLFFGVSFIFGSIAMMLAVALLGTLPAVLVAISGGLYTLAPWGHPYALVVFTVEALVVGLLYRRGLRNLVLADLAYWLVLGAPLVLLFYRGAIGMDWDAVGLIALKQPLNGLFNALIAGLVLIGLRLFCRAAPRLGLQPAGLPDVLFHVLLAAILLAGGLPIVHNGYQQRVVHEAFLGERLRDQAEHFAARIEAEPGTRLADWERQLAAAQRSPDMGLALLGSDGQVLASRGELAMLSGRAGQTQALDGGASIWLPAGNIPTMPRWKKGRYFFVAPVSGAGDIRQVAIELSAAQLVRMLEREGLAEFTLLMGLLLIGVAVARALSQWLTRPLAELERVSRTFTAQIAIGSEPTILTSSVREYRSLGDTLRESARLLSDSFRELHATKAGLDERIRERTAELHNTAALLENVLAAASEFSIIATDTGGVIKVFNKGAENLLGYAAADVVDKQTPALFHRAEEVMARSAELSATFGRPVEGFRVFVEVAEREGAEAREWTYVHKSGRHVPVSLVVSAMRDAQGQLTGYLGIAEDITERKAAERELRDSEQRFRDTAQQLAMATAVAQLGVWDLDLVNGRLDWDAGMFRIYGVEEQGFRHVVEDWSHALLPEYVEQATADFTRGISHPGIPYESEFSIRRPDGQIRHVRAMAQPIADREGRAERVIGINEDITDRKQAETALVEHAQHTQAILDNMVDGIITIDATGIIQSFNPAAEGIFGYAAAEAVGRNVSMLMPSPHREAHDGYLRNYLATGVARIIGVGREVEGQRKDGSLFPMDLTISEVTLQGQPLYVGMVRDISERRRIERMKSEFVSTVSHELRTPLTSISGALGLIAGGALGELPEQARQMIAIAHKNSQRLTHLINDLLDIEKIAAGKLTFEMQVQPLLPLIQQALNSCRTYGAERRVALVLAGEAQHAEVRVDGLRLMQVLANLLSNAIKFSPEGGTVEVEVVTKADKARVAVVDHGPGIPAAFRSRIFEKFAQADASDTRQAGGTGLGLAITRELVERMGGSIGYDSTEGVGATFWFELPLQPAGLPAVLGSTFVTAADAPRILVVEDEPDVAQLLSLMLIRAGYQADIALTGRDALAALQKTAYSALSLDLMLPDIGGLEIIRQLRRRPETADLPIVVVSAKMEEGRLAINGDFSAIDWLAKPIDEHRLLAVVEQLVFQTGGSRPRVLHVEDDNDLYQVVRTMVGDRFDFEEAKTLEEARARVSLERFDVVILDIGLPDGSGWDLLPEIRVRQPDARVVILSGTDTSAEEARRVEAVLLKSQVSPRELLDALGSRIRPIKPGGSKA